MEKYEIYKILKNFKLLGILICLVYLLLILIFGPIISTEQEIKRLELKKEIGLIENDSHNLAKQLTKWADNNCGNKSTYVLFYGYEKKWNCLKSEHSSEYVFME